MNYHKYQDLVYEIIGAAMEVHRTLGPGLLEAVYSEAMHLELLDSGVENELEKDVPCYYKGQKMEKTYRMDMVVDDICVELKSVGQIVPAHRAQLFNYLRLTRMPVGLLINFGGQKLEGERYAFIEEENECCLLDKNMDVVGFPLMED